MSSAKSTLAAIRFGYGLSPVIAPPEVAGDMLAGLAAPDTIAHAHPITGFEEQLAIDVAHRDLKKARKRGEDGAQAAFKTSHRKIIEALEREMVVSAIRPMVSPHGFRERLVRFWADHFTIVANGKGLRTKATAYIEDAIRPHISGSFSDLLRVAATHPVMLVYLDQVLSIGPNSVTGKKRGKGLNENLAREILELHTLGVGSSYSQKDVREFAELLTGLHFHPKKGFKFRSQMAEPGAETVLGQSYGGGRADIDDIYQVLDDLAAHPDTANHLARKLVVHFISDAPDQAIVDHVSAAYTASGGDLMAVYAALLEHPAAWENPNQKAKQPFDFIVSSLRALEVSPDFLLGLNRKNRRLYLGAPMQIMGQPYQQPSGPDGWPEAVEDWITPQGLAARIQWAMITTSAVGNVRDPQEFARTALAEFADDALLQAVGSAESRLEGMALVLASPAFNRR